MRKLFSAAGRSGIIRALRHRDFALYVVAHAGSVVGLWVQRIAIQWLVWSMSGSYAWLGAIAAAEAIAAMCFSLMAGPLADRFDRLKLAYLTQGLLMVLAASLAIIALLGYTSLHVLFAFVVVTGIIEGIWAPVRLALMPNLVPRADLPAAVAITSMMFTAAIFIGPAIGGLVIASIGTEGAFVFNAFSYLGLLLVFGRIKIRPQPVRADEEKLSLFADFRAGIAYVANSHVLRTIVLFGLALSALVRPYRELFAGVADDIFARGAEGLAALASASGLGALIAAVGIAVYGRTEALARVLVMSAAGAACLLMIFARAPSFAVAVAAAAGIAFFTTLFGTGAQMMMQMNLAEDMRGRVMSVWQSQFRGVPAISAWIMGLLEPRFGLSLILFVAASLFGLCLLMILRSQRHLVMAARHKE